MHEKSKLQDTILHIVAFTAPINIDKEQNQETFLVAKQVNISILTMLIMFFVKLIERLF